MQTDCGSLGRWRTLTKLALSSIRVGLNGTASTATASASSSKENGWETWHSGCKVRQTFMPGQVVPQQHRLISSQPTTVLHWLTVSYNEHNQANGENNNDGTNDNDSWNCGAEGWTDDAGINACGSGKKNAVAMLIISQECRCF